jgi:glycosyltransferase involved in cell wall biosynthesis
VVTIPPTSFNYENGLPNKLFQYIQARLPIIAGPLQEVAEIVTEEDIGIVTKDFKVESIIAAYRSFISLKNNHFEESLEKAAKKYSVENENVTRRLILSSMVSSLDVGNV